MKKVALLIMLGFVIHFTAWSQNDKIPVKGIVMESDSVPLPGVNVEVQGNGEGTTTDFDGEFSIEVEAAGPILKFSHVGFQTKEILVEDEDELFVVLQEESSELAEVVVTGYTKQRKANLTGSVSSVGSENFDSRPVTNVSSALSGIIPGMSVQQNSGDPRSDGSTIKIRGTGTLNDSSPLVLIDGMPGNMDDVNPEDIDNISVLKDAASAAIYGARAANGVVLITTKQGTNAEPKVNYSGQFSFAEPMKVPKFINDYAQHMTLINQGSENIEQSSVFSDKTIEEWREAAQNPNGTTDKGTPNYLAYPNTDWGDALFEHNLVQKHNISVNGGGENVRYYLTAGYLNNPGTMANTKKERYQLRANIEADVGEHLTLGTQTFASMEKLDKGNTDEAFNFLRQTTPGIVPEHDGKFGGAQAPGESATTNGVTQKLKQNKGEDKVNRLNTTLFATVRIIDGLTLDSKINYNTFYNEVSTNPRPYEEWNWLKDELITPEGDPKDMTTSRSFNKNQRYTFNHILNFQRKIANDHNLNVMAGYEETYSKTYDWNASMKGLIDPNITELGSANEMNGIGGGATDHATRSVFGRINYDFKDKYLMEGNLRYDGTSRFSSDRRWGIFPSVSAGWRISEEEFFKSWDANVQDLKIRGSWGRLGNSSIGDYDYQAAYGTVNYSFNDRSATGLRKEKLPNEDLRWEETEAIGLGLDLTILNGRLNTSLDIYDKQTNGILTSPPIHLTMGDVGAPTINTAGVNNRGVELAVDWKDNIGGFQYFVGGNFSYNKNKVSKYQGKLERGFVTNDEGEEEYKTNLGDVSSGGVERILEDHRINEYYMRTLYKGDGSYTSSDGAVNTNGGPKDGMIRTDEDYEWVKAMEDEGYEFLPVGQTGKTQIYKGDFIYADNNGDGVYGGTDDQVFMNYNSEPKYTYGLNAGFSWKNIDFSMQWAGSAGMKYYWLDGQGGNSNVTRNGMTLFKRIADDHYYLNENNSDDPLNNMDGTYPRLKDINDPQNNVASDFWLYNASYIKLKNVQAGYTLPENWTKNISMDYARFYISAENLLTITDYPGVDPEVGAGYVYPSMRQITFGVDITFK